MIVRMLDQYPTQYAVVLVSIICVTQQALLFADSFACAVQFV